MNQDIKWYNFFFYSKFIIFLAEIEFFTKFGLIWCVKHLFYNHFFGIFDIFVQFSWNSTNFGSFWSIWPFLVMKLKIFIKFFYNRKWFWVEIRYNSINLLCMINFCKFWSIFDAYDHFRSWKFQFEDYFQNPDRFSGRIRYYLPIFVDI